ncbi:MAG: (NiFe) hydrogenase maturation protein HypF [Actinomycetia bacterium]|nr:(NiFe) hydrogenase maturation protein HypF [Actinomycetes bacterium]
MARTHTRLRVTGTVQGVGFRPFVYRHAVALGLAGSVWNDSEGVLIDVEGDEDGIDELGRLLVDEPPPLARVSNVVAERIERALGARTFEIVESHDGGRPDVPVSVDTATCAECLAEIEDPGDRRYRYPFTNCTNCGPRYTIVRSVPYDRPATTMAGFPMCERCRAEYDDSRDRRFHAQPNACPTCGPQLAWRAPDGAVLAERDAALRAAVDALKSGHIVAMKGIGGYHLVVDATDASAVRELRRRKARDDKPFAVMVRDLHAARQLGVIDEAAQRALCSSRRPIVLVPVRAGAPVAPDVAPGLPELGLFLPYSPLHHLLVAGVERPIVCTSGNLSDEPIAHADDDAVTRLGALADGFLTHDRPIHIRCDDSVVRAAGGRLQLLRRSRGYAPEPMRLPAAAPAPVLAVGAELKSTVAVAKRDEVVASHHIGDLEHLPTWRSFEQAVGHLCALYGVVPEVVAHDLHPEYLSTKYASELDLPDVAVQHHHAHVAACMAEHDVTSVVLGLAFDGLGYGPDGTMWGGEFLVADLCTFTRAGHLRPVVLPGGAAAIREPWRMAVAWAQLAMGSALTRDRLGGMEPRAGQLIDLLDAGPVGTSARTTTSVGRLFDAVAAILGCRNRVSYEAQAAIELEALARTVARADAPIYPDLVPVARVDRMMVLDPAPLVAALIDSRDHVEIPLLAAAFHETLGRAAAELAIDLASGYALDTVALTGGVFQNARFSAIVEDALRAAGLRVLVHELVPANDGGISIGQAAVAAARSATGVDPKDSGVSSRRANQSPKRGGAAPLPIPQLCPPRRPGSSSSGGRGR